MVSPSGCGIPAGRLQIWLSAFLVVLSMTGCALTPFQRTRNSPQKIVNPAKKMRAENYFVKAREYEMLGLGKNALFCYEAAYELDPQSRTLRDLLVEKYLSMSQVSRALVLVKNGKKEEALSDDDKRACAGIYLRQGRIGSVTDLIEQIKDKRPEEYHTLALVFESKGNIAKAIYYYKGFLEKKPESFEIWLKTAQLFTALKRYDAAESLFVDMERRFGQTPDLLNAIGQVKLAKGDTALAINSFTMASLIDTVYQEGTKNLAKIYLQQGKWEQAIGYYEKLHAVAPDSVSYAKALALLYFYSKNYAKAWSLFSQMLEGDESNPEIHFYGGLTLVSLDSTAHARWEFEHVLAIDRLFPDAWQQLCYLAVKENDYDRALSIADSFKTAMPRLAAAWRMGAYVYNVRKEYERALPLLKKALELDSSDAHTWFELGMSLERTKEKEKAALAFKKVLSLEPGDPPAANYLAYMWAEQGIHLDSARLLLSMALKQDSLNGAYLDSYAWIFYKMGAIDTAYMFINKALQRIKDDPVVYAHYGDILVKKGDYSSALETYKRGLELALPDKATPEEIVDLKKKITDVEMLLQSKTKKTP
jgi:tetratricopeptide (TPR) repeat protein